MSNSTKPLTGKVPQSAIRQFSIERLPQTVLDRFRALDDLCCTVSDAMDDLGIVGGVPASDLVPNLLAKRVVGHAITVRNVARQDGVSAASATRKGRMGEHEAYNLSEPGDVVVIEGLTGVSNMGGQSVTLAHRSGCQAAVIDGSYRDPSASREINFPIWSRGVTPVTGKWRLETVEINGPVSIAGTAVHPGDLVLADDSGIAIVPFSLAMDVLARAEQIAAGDQCQRNDIAAGASIQDLARKQYK